MSAGRIKPRRSFFLWRWCCQKGMHRWVSPSSGLYRGCVHCGKQQVFSSVVGTWINESVGREGKR